MIIISANYTDPTETVIRVVYNDGSAVFINKKPGEILDALKDNEIEITGPE